MNRIIIKLPVLILGSFSLAVNAQQFQDLNFESATVSSSPPANYPNPVSAASALPGWTVLLGNDVQTVVQYNTDTTGAAAVDLIGPTWGSVAPGIINGNYTVFLQSGLANGPVNTSIEQNGTVPVDAESLQFKAWVEPGVGTANVAVSFAGNLLSLTPISSAVAPSGQPYTIYGANITPYDGQTGLLEFTSLYNGSQPGLLLDDITFSTSSVPEPSPAILIALGGLIFVVRRKMASR